MRVRRLVVATALLLSMLAGPARAGAQGEEAGLGALCAVGNLLYFPVKFFFAAGGLVTGGIAGALSGGDERTAYALWVPTAGGDYFLRAEHCLGDATAEIVGTDYADRPSERGRGTDRTYTYEALYQPAN